jgi:hypothetical protein
MGQGIKNYFRFFENRKKRLRAFAQQLFHTNVLNKCMKQVFDFACPELANVNRFFRNG